MRIHRRTLAFIITGCLVITGFFVSGYFIKNSYAKRLPPLPDPSHMPGPVREQLSESVKRAEHNPDNDNLGNLGMAFHANAFYKEAAQCYELAIERKKSDWKWNYYLGLINNEMGDSRSAVLNFKNALKGNPREGLAWFYLGKAFQNIGDIAEAEKAFDKIEIQPVIAKTGANRKDHFPLWVYAQFQKARVFSGSNRNENAEKILLQITKEYPSFGPAYRLLGSISKDTRTAQKYAVRANDMTLYNEPVDSLVDRLSLISRSDRFLLKKIDEAEKGGYTDWELKLVINGFNYMPENKYLISKFVKLYLKMDIGKESSPLLTRHKALFNDDFNEISSVGYLLYLKGMHGQALDYYRLARKIRPDDIPTHTSIILCLWNTASRKQAVDSTLFWLGHNMGNPKILKEGVGLLINLKEISLAKNYFNRLKNMSTDKTDILSFSGKIAEAEGKIPEATGYYESAVKLNPEDISNQRFLINLYISRKMWNNAIGSLRQALDYHPNDAYFLERLGTLLVMCPDMQFRNPAEGKEYSERAFYHSNIEPATLIGAGESLAAAYATAGDKKSAYSTISNTISLAKQQRVSTVYLSELEKMRASFK